MAESSEPSIPVVPRIETAMSAAEEERCNAMLDKLLAKMDEQGRKMDDMISSLAATTSWLLGAAADSTPSSPSTTVGLATVSSWVVAAQTAVNTFDTDVNFATPTKCSTWCPDHDDGKLTVTTTRASTLATGKAEVRVERTKQVEGANESSYKMSKPLPPGKEELVVNLQQPGNHAPEVFDEMIREANEPSAGEEFTTSLQQVESSIVISYREGDDTAAWLWQALVVGHTLAWGQASSHRTGSVTPVQRYGSKGPTGQCPMLCIRAALYSHWDASMQ